MRCLTTKLCWFKEQAVPMSEYIAKCTLFSKCQVGSCITSYWPIHCSGCQDPLVTVAATVQSRAATTVKGEEQGEYRCRIYTRDTTRVLFLNCCLINNLSWQASVLFNYICEMIESNREKGSIGTTEKIKRKISPAEQIKEKLQPAPHINCTNDCWSSLCNNLS